MARQIVSAARVALAAEREVPSKMARLIVSTVRVVLAAARNDADLQSAVPLAKMHA